MGLYGRWWGRVVRNDMAACGSMVGGDMAGPGVLWSVLMWQGGRCMVNDMAGAVWSMVWQGVYGR